MRPRSIGRAQDQVCIALGTVCTGDAVDTDVGRQVLRIRTGEQAAVQRGELVMGNGGALRGGGVGGAGDGLGLRGRGGLGGRWGFSVRWQCASAGWRCFSTGRRRVSAGRRRGGIRAGCAVSGAAGAGVVGVAGAVDGAVRVVTPDIVMLEGSGGFTVLGNDGRRVLVSLFPVHRAGPAMSKAACRGWNCCRWQPLPRRQV